MAGLTRGAEAAKPLAPAKGTAAVTRADRILRRTARAPALRIACAFTWDQRHKPAGHPGSVDCIFQPLGDWFRIPPP